MDIGGLQNQKIIPWELKHVTSLDVGLTGQSTTIGIPNKPCECAMVYDIGGPVRTFKISGLRYDCEEDISNYDFIHQQFNHRRGIPYIVPFVGTEYITSNDWSVGIEWLASVMQTILKGYVFTIDANDDESRIKSGSYIVGLTSFSYSLSSSDYSKMTYSLTFTERRPYDAGPCYKAYSSNFVRQ